jgi:glutaredoxin 3
MSEATMPKVVIYSRPFCGYCELAKDLLEQKGVPFSEIDVEADRSRLSEMVSRSGGRMTFPQIFVGEHHVGGFTDLASLDRRGGLDELLSA